MTDNHNPFAATVIGIPTEEGLLLSSGEGAERAWEVVLNIGAQDGVSLHQKYVIFSLGPELKDPNTDESLGCFEVVRGQGRVTHVQERMCILRSQNTRSAARSALNAMVSITGGRVSGELQEVAAPFEDIYVGDLARRI